MKLLQESDFIEAAKQLNCEVGAIKAVAEVESRGSGFLPDGRPKILFERHYFHRLTNGVFSSNHPEISNPVSGGYGAESIQHTKLERAAKLNRAAALQSASWGKFQIMGANWKSLGYISLQEFINAMYSSEAGQLNGFVRFVKANKLDDELRNKNWAGFALGYNGKAYAKNSYDKKIAAAYQKYSKK